MSFYLTYYHIIYIICIANSAGIKTSNFQPGNFLSNDNINFEKNILVKSMLNTATALVLWEDITGVHGI